MKGTNITLLLIALALSLASCNKDNSQKIEVLSGQVLYQDSIPAPGASVYISSGPNASNVIAEVRTNLEGKFQINLGDGTYFISSNYTTGNDLDPANIAGYQFKMDEEMALDFKKRENIKIKLASGTDADDQRFWKSDGYKVNIAQSNITFDIWDGYFFGTFQSMGFDELFFKENSPYDIAVDFWVDVTSASTNVDEADGLNGSIAQTLGVQFEVDGPEDTTAAGAYTREAIVGDTHLARFVCEPGSSVYFGDGFKTTGMLTINDITLPADFYYHLIKSGIEGEIYLRRLNVTYELDDVPGSEVTIKLNLKLTQ